MTDRRVVDLNADLGESFGIWRLGDDEALLGVVSSANVACGFHAGDPVTLRRTCAAAVARGVTIGAQVSYRDLAGFGRRFLDVEPAELTAEIIYQIGGLDGVARSVGGRVRYLKPHGALYHAVLGHRGQATAVVDAVLALDPSLPVLTQPGSLLAQIASAAGVPVVHEAFADRGYRADGTLLPRSGPGAVLADPVEVAARVVRLVTTGTLLAADGTELQLQPGSVCVHGDSPGAVAMARAVREALTAAGVDLVPFASP